MTRCIAFATESAEDWYEMMTSTSAFADRDEERNANPAGWPASEGPVASERRRWPPPLKPRVGRLSRKKKSARRHRTRAYVYGVRRRQSWNLGINRGSVIPMPTAATTSTYCMGSSCPWALRRVLAVEIKLDGAGYVAGGVNTGQGAASKSGSRLEVSARRASACPPHSMPSRTGNDGGGPACTVPPTGPRFGARMPMVTMSASSPAAGAWRNGFRHWSAT